MLTLHELRADGMALGDARRNARYPVLLVHGFASSESVWTPLRRALPIRCGRAIWVGMLCPNSID